MKPTLVVAGAFVLLILGVSVLDFVRKRSIAASVQCLGAAFLIVVVFAHIAEALGLFPSMGWGLPHSMGHYIDLTSAVCGLLFLSAGYLLRRLRKHAA
jgi:ABC-type antimicrobial peptide transport system permease subunit